MGTVFLDLYLGFSRVNAWVYRKFLDKRLKAGKEDPDRIGERFGFDERARPDGKLVWFHAASVGESLSLDTVVDGLLKRRPDVSILVTSTTITSARILTEKLPDRAFHAFSPVDNKAAVQRFLQHWKPDVAVWTESELWPRMMVETVAAKIPMLLVNARVSDKTAGTWRKFPRTAASLLGMFDAILVQEEPVADLMRGLGVQRGRVRVTGSTKEDAPPLPVDAQALAELDKAIGPRGRWLAASTHEGEETEIADAHAKAFPNPAAAPLLIVAPRHPERGDDVTALFRDRGWTVSQRSKDEPIAPDTQVYVADTIGEMGLWYRLSPLSFIGGSFMPVGGHNPFEPIALGSLVLSGPRVFNFAQVYERLAAQEAFLTVIDSNALADMLVVLQDPARRQPTIDRATAATRKDGSATANVLAEINRRLG